MNENTVANWISLAEYDLATADSMLSAARYLYVAFTCQQAIEKVLKAYYVYRYGKTPPYTHNLNKLAEETGLAEAMSEKQISFLDSLNAYYIQSRYTEEIQTLSVSFTHERAVALIAEMKEVYQWLRSKIAIR